MRRLERSDVGREKSTKVNTVITKLSLQQSEEMCVWFRKAFKNHPTAPYCAETVLKSDWANSGTSKGGVSKVLSSLSTATTGMEGQ